MCLGMKELDWPMLPSDRTTRIAAIDSYDGEREDAMALAGLNVQRRDAAPATRRCSGHSSRSTGPQRSGRGS